MRYQNSTHPHRAPYQPPAKNNYSEDFSYDLTQLLGKCMRIRSNTRSSGQTCFCLVVFWHVGLFEKPLGCDTPPRATAAPFLPLGICVHRSWGAWRTWWPDFFSQFSSFCWGGNMHRCRPAIFGTCSTVVFLANWDVNPGAKGTIRNPSPVRKEGGHQIISPSPLATSSPGIHKKYQEIIPTILYKRDDF